MKESEYCNYVTCKKCGGSCCQSLGCEIFPEDFKDSITLDVLQKLIETGVVSIDSYEGYPIDSCEISDDYCGTSYFIRIRNRKSSVVDYSWGGTCVLFTDEIGCELPFKLRPYGGRSLHPKDAIHRYCWYTEDDDHEIVGKQLAAIKWLPYNSLIHNLEKWVHEYDKNKNDSLPLDKVRKIFSEIFINHD